MLEQGTQNAQGLMKGEEIWEEGILMSFPLEWDPRGRERGRLGLEPKGLDFPTQIKSTHFIKCSPTLSQC